MWRSMWVYKKNSPIRRLVSGEALHRKLNITWEMQSNYIYITVSQRAKVRSSIVQAKSRGKSVSYSAQQRKEARMLEKVQLQCPQMQHMSRAASNPRRRPDDPDMRHQEQGRKLRRGQTLSAALAYGIRDETEGAGTEGAKRCMRNEMYGKNVECCGISRHRERVIEWARKARRETTLDHCAWANV